MAPPLVSPHTGGASEGGDGGGGTRPGTLLSEGAPPRPMRPFLPPVGFDCQGVIFPYSLRSALCRLRDQSGQQRSAADCPIRGANGTAVAGLIERDQAPSGRSASKRGDHSTLLRVVSTKL